jgi:hypothetical protein
VYVKVYLPLESITLTKISAKLARYTRASVLLRDINTRFLDYA